MVKKKINFWYIFIGLIIIILIVAFYKNINNHHKQEYKVVNKKILESAKKCYLKGDCTGEITLKDLYDKKYLETQIDPVTKENMKENICIKYDNNEAKFC